MLTHSPPRDVATSEQHLHNDVGLIRLTSPALCCRSQAVHNKRCYRVIRLARYASEGMLVTGRHALSQPVHRRLGLIHKPLRGGLKHSCDAVELLIIAQATLRSFGVYNPVGYSNRRNQCHFWQEQSRSGLVPNINARSGLPQVPAVGKPLRTECGSIGHLVQDCRKRDDPSSNKETVPFLLNQRLEKNWPNRAASISKVTVPGPRVDNPDSNCYSNPLPTRQGCCFAQSAQLIRQLIRCRVCSGMDASCTDSSKQVTSIISALDERNGTFEFTMTAIALENSPYDVIKGRPSILQHSLVERFPSHFIPLGCSVVSSDNHPQANAVAEPVGISDSSRPPVAEPTLREERRGKGIRQKRTQVKENTTALVRKYRAYYIVPRPSRESPG